jgi:hypothetical protein
VVAAEIGGAFWAPDLAEGPAKLVLCPDGHAACNGLLAEALASYAAADVLLLAEGLPERQRQRARRLGLEVVASPVNPWSVLRR